MPLLTIIRGLPGSGKSTLAQALGIPHFEADMYFVGDGGIYQFDQSQLKAAHEWCLASVRATLLAGADCVVSNTFVKKWEIQPYLALGYPVQIIHVQGNFGNVHNVPDFIVERMRAQWEEIKL